MTDLSNTIVTDFSAHEWDALTKRQRVQILKQTPEHVRKAWAAREADVWSSGRSSGGIAGLIGKIWLWICILAFLFMLFIVIGFKTGLLYDPNETQFQRDKAAGIETPSVSVEDLNRQQNEEAMQQQQHAAQVEARRQARIAAETMQDRPPAIHAAQQ